jgi:hypothetical protein
MLWKEKKFKMVGLINIDEIVEKLGRVCAPILDKAWR